jgi:hypothetical protein
MGDRKWITEWLAGMNIGWEKKYVIFCGIKRNGNTENVDYFPPTL